VVVVVGNGGSTNTHTPTQQADTTPTHTHPHINTRPANTIFSWPKRKVCSFPNAFLFIYPLN